MSLKVQGTVVIDNSRNATLNNLTASGSVTLPLDAGSYQLTRSQIAAVKSLSTVAVTGNINDLSGPALNFNATNLTATTLVASTSSTGVTTTANLAVDGQLYVTAPSTVSNYITGYSTFFGGGPNYGGAFEFRTNGGGSGADNGILNVNNGSQIVINGGTTLAVYGTLVDNSGQYGTSGQVLTNVNNGEVAWKTISTSQSGINSLDDLLDSGNTGGYLYLGTGGNYYDQLYGSVGQNTYSSLLSPTQIGTNQNWRQVTGGNHYSRAGIKTDNTLWTWGANYHGALGLGNVTDTSSPTQIGGNNWAQVSVGCSMAAIKTDGTLWVWGDNTYGQLGLGNTTNYSSPVQVGNLTNWASVSVGAVYTLATKTDGTLWAWGANTNGNLGLGDVANRSSPVQVGALTNWSYVATSAGYNPGFYQSYNPFGNYNATLSQAGSTAAIKTDGTLWTWGFNNGGQLGQGTTSQLSSPVQITGYQGGAAIVSGWKHVAIDITHMVAVGNDGSAWSCGYGGYTWGWGVGGQLGLGNTYNFTTPALTRIGGSNTWKYASVAATWGTDWNRNAYPNANGSSLYVNGVSALTGNDGSVWAFGDVWKLTNQYGNQSVPVQITAAQYYNGVTTLSTSSTFGAVKNTVVTTTGMIATTYTYLSTPTGTPKANIGVRRLTINDGIFWANGAAFSSGSGGGGGGSFTGGSVNNATQFVNGTASTSTSTGAVTVGGGIGIAGNAYIGAGAYITGNVTAGSTYTLTNAVANTGVVVNGTSQTAVYYCSFSGSNYLSIPNSSTIQLGTGDFTCECWFYQTSSAINQRLWGMGGYSTSGNFELEMPGNSSNIINVHINGSYTSYTNTGGLLLNQWNHIAVVRISGVVNLYFNGVSLGSATQSGSINSSSAFIIGADNGGDNYHGYISNFRVIKGTGIYTTAFTPPNANFTAVSGTVILTAQNASIIDNSGNNWTITNSGSVTTASALTSFSPTVGTYLTWVYDGTSSWKTTGGVVSTNGFFWANGSAYSTGSSFTGGSVSGVTTFANSATSTSTTTGGLIVSGGAGVAGNVNVGGLVNVTGNVNVSSAVNVTGNAIISGTVNKIAGMTVVTQVEHGITTVGSTSSSTYSFDLSTSNYFTISTTSACTFTFNTANTYTPNSYLLSFVIRLTPSSTITWPSSVIWPAGTAPTLTTGSTHLCVFTSDNGGSTWRGAAILNYAS